MQLLFDLRENINHHFSQYQHVLDEHILQVLAVIHERSVEHRMVTAKLLHMRKYIPRALQEQEVLVACLDFRRLLHVIYISLGSLVH